MAAVPIGPFVRFVLFGATAAYENWDTISGLFDKHTETGSAPIMGQYVQHVFQMKDASGTYADKERGLVGVHWVNSTGGELDTTWTSADYALVETGMQTLWANLSSSISTEFKLVEHRWYPFGPGVLPPNPPSRVTTIASPIAGTATQVMPHQVATNFTFRTPLRRHWGRICLPISNPAAYGAGGETTSAQVDSYASQGSTYIKSGTANGLAPVVYDRVRKAALGVTALEVDSVPDIIRRRRPRTTAYKKILTS